jgi:phytoene dehydrogenase-like protein
MGKEQDSILLKSFGTEPSYSPEGKNILQTLLVQHEDDFERWATFYEVNREAYRQEKEKVAKAIVAAIEEKFPQLKGKMTVVETVSPYSYYRFCGAYKGAYMSFILTPFAKKKTHKGRLRKIKNVYLAGQWLQPPGGLPNAGATGRFVIQRICKQENIAFDNNFKF